jgi:hypothetical protein
MAKLTKKDKTTFLVVNSLMVAGFWFLADDSEQFVFLVLLVLTLNLGFLAIGALYSHHEERSYIDMHRRGLLRKGSTLTEDDQFLVDDLERREVELENRPALLQPIIAIVLFLISAFMLWVQWTK